MIKVLQIPFCLSAAMCIVSDGMCVADSSSAVASEMPFSVSRLSDAGNVRIISLDKSGMVFSNELRDTQGNWFYWAFEAVFSKPGDYKFTLVPPALMGTRGPAFSYDNGITWQWLDHSKVSHKDKCFTYTHDESAPAKVRFCISMQYLQKNLENFLNSVKNDRNITASVICVSRQGRDVELLKVSEGAENGKKKILLTSRHHCCEMTANYVMEGLIAAALADDGLGRDARKKLVIYAVPFVDKDGVENGDQGKNRKPHDHGRDYIMDSIYPEPAAIKKLIIEAEPFAVMDIHCPYISGGVHNETIYCPSPKAQRFQDELKIFARILERNAPDEAPFHTKDILWYGTGWNTDSNYSGGMGLKMFLETCSFVKLGFSFEIPYANAREKTLDQKSLRLFGRSLLKSIIEYAGE